MFPLSGSPWCCEKKVYFVHVRLSKQKPDCKLSYFIFWKVALKQVFDKIKDPSSQNGLNFICV